MSSITGKTDSLHFNVTEGIREEAFVDNLKQYRISVAFTDDKGKLTGNDIKFVVTATSTKVAFEMIETFAVQVKNLSPEQFEKFKENHKFTFFHAALNRTDDKKTKGADAREVTLYKPHRLRNDLEKAFGKKLGKEEVHLSNKVLKEIKEYAKMLEGRIEGHEHGTRTHPHVGARFIDADL